MTTLAATPPLLAQSRAKQPELGARVVPVLTVDGLRFRDLDRDGKLSPFEDWRRPAEQRAADLVARMTLDEKAGAMMHPVLDVKSPERQIGGLHVTSMLLRAGGTPAAMAERINEAQEIAERQRLAIPLTISTDPRNGIADSQFGLTVAAGRFSRWPDPTGLAAIGDPAVTRAFGRIAAQEYRATGITMALSPQADLATEPRWGRISGTFGEDAAQIGALTAAYVEGFQGSMRGPTTTGVATVIKHFSGYGAQEEGFDSHSYYGRFGKLTARQLDQHTAAFRPAFRVQTAGVMPTYSILRVPGHPGIAGGFDRVLLQDILRKREGYRGLVVSDWGITQDCDEICRNGRVLGGPIPKKITRGKPWGVEDMPAADRFVLAVSAGIDQIGDEEDGAPIVAAVRAGKLPEARIDDAVRRAMAIKFRLGLFENPYVDPARATAIVGRDDFVAAGLAAQQRSLVLLENRGAVLPVRSRGKRVWLKGIDPRVATALGFVVVDTPAQAELAIVRTATPWQRLHPGYIMGGVMHEGDLDFKDDNADLIAIREAAKHVPVIATVYLDRPAILTELRKSTAGLIGNFGVTDEALLNVIVGRARPEGRLPFELPSSNAAVAAQDSAKPHDSRNPLYRFGFGLRYR